MNRGLLGGIAVAAALSGSLLAVLVDPPTQALAPIEVRQVDVDRGVGEQVAPPPAPQRTVAVYGGYGAWVDVFDFSPPYAGESPPITPASLDEMVDGAVDTLYLQAARLDDRSPLGLEDPWLLAEFLHAAHERGIAVVAWYLPRWSDDDSDFDRLMMLDQFSVLGQRFDGVAVDIEWTGGDMSNEQRNERLVELTARAAAGVDGPLGAIVLPPVLTDVINTEFWPDFPWAEIADGYDVWLPMSYWSFRSDRSGYGEGYLYNEESVRRLRAHLGDPGALVHSIGGIGGVDGVDDPADPPEPLATATEIEAFVRSLIDTGSIGGSIYDWRTLELAVRAQLAEAFTSGPASQLGVSLQ